MRFARDLIIRPIISEKSHSLSEENKYTFEVAVESNKHQISDAIEEIFNVDVVRVNTMKVKGKPKKLGRKQLSQGYTSTWKKAVITLKPGQKIEIFGGV